MRHGVILAGGGGTRLWPVSRASRPKQFLDLGTGQSLLAATVARVRKVVGDELVIVTARDQVDLVHSALPGLPNRQLIAEPAARNTAPAIGLAAALLLADDPDATLAILPSDHHVADPTEFANTCEAALDAAEERDAIITVGIVPSAPETGYGYLELGDDAGPVRRVMRFAEKPDRAGADAYLKAGNALWNAGMFFARAEVLLAEIRRHLPALGEILDPIQSAARDGDRAAALALAESHYASTESISIDYGVMERATEVWTVPGTFGWNDIGSWTSVDKLHPRDRVGNTQVGDVIALDCENTIAFADDGLIAAVGVEGLVIVKSGNAVLVTTRDSAQRVREVVASIRERELDEYS